MLFDALVQTFAKRQQQTFLEWHHHGFIEFFEAFPYALSHSGLHCRLLVLCWRFLSSEHLAAPSTRNTLRAYTDEGEQRLRLDQRVPFYRSVIGSGQKLPLPCGRSEEHTSELQSLMRISYAVFCLKKKR